MMRVLSIFSIENYKTRHLRMLELAAVALALAFDEKEARMFQITDEFADFARHDRSMPGGGRLIKPRQGQ
jgi:hypothetical protein